MSVVFDPETSLATEDELSGIAELRDALVDDLASAPSSSFEEVAGDIRLLRFLRSRSTVSEAAEMYRSMLSCRAAHGMDDVRREVIENGLDHSKAPHQDELDEVAPHFTRWDAGRTPDGDILTVLRPGNIDVGRIFDVITPEQVMENFRYHLEILSVKVDRASRESGRLVKFVRVQDMREVTMGHGVIVRKVVRPFLSEFQASHAGMIKTVFLLHTPEVFTAIFALVSSLMNENMKRRMRPLGENYQSTILQSCGSEVFLRLEEARKAGPKGSSHELGEATAVVPAWGKVEFDVCVKEGDVVKWDLRPDGSVGFCANSYGQDGTATVVKLIKDMSDGESGEFKAAEDGVLSIIFDNAAAWLNQRIVDYNIQLVEVKA